MMTLQAEAAKVAIMALFATMTDGAVSLDTVFVDGKGPMPFDAAAVQLAEGPFPRECRANARSEGLEVHCTSLSSDATAIHRYAVDDLAAKRGLLAVIPQELDAQHVQVLVVAKGKRLLVSLSAVQEWVKSFVIIENLSSSIRDPNAEERASGVAAVLEFGRPEDLSFLLRR